MKPISGAKLLLVSPVRLHPATSGNRQRILQLGAALRERGFEVELAIGKPKFSDTGSSEFWSKVHLLKNSPLWKPSRRIAKFDSWYSQGLGEEIAEVVSEQEITGVILPYVFHSKIFTFLPQKVKKVIDTHDVFANRKDLLGSSWRSPRFFACTDADESAYLQRATRIIAISKQDQEHLQRQTDSPVLYVPFLPPRFNEEERVPSNSPAANKFGIVMSANEPNLASLLDFISAVDSRFMKSPPFMVEVAGGIRNLIFLNPKLLSYFFRTKWIRFTGTQANLDSFYEGVSAIIVPIIAGTGVSIKFIEAVARGTPTISTSSGSRGFKSNSPFHNYNSNRALVDGLAKFSQSDHMEILKSQLETMSRLRYEFESGFEDLCEHLAE